MNQPHFPIDPEGADPNFTQPGRLVELFQVFLQLGALGFGGPAAHIALMEREIVQQRQWLTGEQLLDLIGITNLIPGPNSTELAMAIGYERAGWRGLAVAGSGFILPAMGMVWGLAALYGRYQTVPQVGGLLYGIKPVVMAIVLQALWQLGRQAVKDGPTLAAGLGVLGGGLLGLPELLLLGGAGLAVMLWRLVRRRQSRQTLALAWPLLLGLLPAAVATVAVPPTVLQVFWVFFKMALVLYGSGYVLLAYLQQELVERLHWLSAAQLLDAIAIGQLTPGPVSTTATFIGYLLAGNWGAVAATLGMFLPAFGLVGLIHPWVPRLRRWIWVGDALAGVNAAAWGLMAAVVGQLAMAALVDGPTVLGALVAGVLLGRYALNAAWLVLAGGLCGWLLKGFVST